MKILIVAESHFKEYGGPFTAINQKIEYFNNKNIKTKLIFNKTNFYKFNLDLHFVINDYDIVHIYGMWRPFLIRVSISEIIELIFSVALGSKSGFIMPSDSKSSCIESIYF